MAMAYDSSGLDQLRTGALGWVRRNAGYLDSPSASAELPSTPRAKAFLQLAQLCRSWARVAPDDPGLDEVAALIQRVWRRPELPDVLAAEPRFARQYGLMYGALAPAPAAAGPHQAVLARLAADGYLSSPGKSPYLRLETRYYADMAGVDHEIESYPELYGSSLLARRMTAVPVTEDEACNITHTIFYLSDYGSRDPGVDGSELAWAQRIVIELTGHYVQRDEWDHAGKFLLAQFCLGVNPAGTPSGAACIRMLAQIQEPSGAIPGRSIRLVPDPAATVVQRFRKAYQPTLMAALMSLMISVGRAPACR